MYTSTNITPPSSAEVKERVELNLIPIALLRLVVVVVEEVVVMVVIIIIIIIIIAV